jgi:hypothetical protein
LPRAPGSPAAVVADDTSKALATAYQAQGLTAVLVGADGSVTLSQVMRDLTARDTGTGIAAGWTVPVTYPAQPIAPAAGWRPAVTAAARDHGPRA